MKRYSARSVIWAVLLLTAASGGAKETTLNAAALLEPSVLKTGFWGTSPEESMRRLQVRARAPFERTQPEPYVSGGLTALWRVPPETAAELDWVDIGTGTWMVFYRDRLLAVVAKERMHEWHRLMGSTYRRYGASDALEAAAPTRSSDTPHVLRGNEWKVRGSRIAFFKVERLAPFEWRDPETGLLVHEELIEAPKGADVTGPHAMHHLHDLDLPFYMAVFDAKSLAALRAPPKPKNRP